MHYEVTINIKVDPDANFLGVDRSIPHDLDVLQEMIQDCLYDLDDITVEDCEVTIKGTGNGKEGAVKGISDAGIRVLKLIDQTGFPHNGCRQSKRKRN